MVPIDDLVPNGYNPNGMTPEQFQELVAETKHNRGIAKPIIARRVNGKLTIVNGEHNWRAAKAAGLAKVPVEIWEIDGFEAMRQTLKRNQHGEHDPLREGLMYQEMMEMKSLSIRKLATKINVADGTIRNRLKYVEALELRKACAADRGGDSAEDDQKLIAELSLEQVPAYLRLPAIVRDCWLDAGAPIKVLTEKVIVDDEKQAIWTGEQLLSLVHDYGIADLLKPDKGFRQSLEAAGKLALWCIDAPFIENVGDYVRPLGELGLPAKVLGLLPYKRTGDGGASVMLSPEQWRDILRKSTAETQDGTYRLKLIGDAVRAALVKAGLDPAKALTAHQVKCLSALQEAPDFIRDAEWLSIEERYKLLQVNGSADDGLVEEAKEMTVEEFRRRRVDQDENDPPQYEGKTVLSVFQECLEAAQARAAGRPGGKPV